MVIEKVHGIQSTSISLNDRFTALASAAPDRVAMRQQQQRRRNSMGGLLTQNLNYGSRLLVEQVARRLEMHAKRALKQRLGLPQTGLRRFGSESNLPRLRRSNSFGNLSQQSVKNRVSWRQSNGNLRSPSFSNLASAAWRGFRRRGGGLRQLRGRFRGRGRGARAMSNGVTRMTRAQYLARQRQRARVLANRRGGTGNRGGRGARGARGIGRGGVTRNQEKPKPVTKEDLDRELDQYMAGSKAALDAELDNYMRNAMELE